MNTHCVNCASIRTVAVVRGGGAVAHFRCDDTDERRTHLVYGDTPACLKPVEQSVVVIEKPTDLYASQESGR